MIPAEYRLSPNSDLPFPSPHSLLNAPSLASTLSHSAPSRGSPPSCARFQYLTVGPHRTSPKQNQQQQQQQQPQLEVPRQDSCGFHGWMGSDASARTLGSARQYCELGAAAQLCRGGAPQPGALVVLLEAELGWRGARSSSPLPAHPLRSCGFAKCLWERTVAAARQ